MPDERSLILHMHELLQYLNRQGVSTFLTVAQHGLFGDMQSPVDVTYLADTVILLRYFEAAGKVRRAISVIKKRTGGHEDTIREFSIDSSGLTLGPGVTASVAGAQAQVTTAAGRRLTLAAEGTEWTMEAAPYSPGFNRRADTVRLVLKGSVDARGPEGRVSTVTMTLL